MTWLDAELQRITDDQTGKYSHDDIQAAQSWKLTWERRWESTVKAQAAEREAGNREKQDRLYAHVRASQKRADQNRRDLESGDLTITEFLNRSSRLKLEADEYERRLHGLESAESLIDQMRGDPVGWQDSFFEKWVALRRLRPKVDDWIQDARVTRRNKSREPVKK